MSEAAKPGTLTDTEREVSQRLSQGFAWPTVLLLLSLIAIEGAVIAAWAGGAMLAGSLFRFALLFTFALRRLFLALLFLLALFLLLDAASLFPFAFLFGLSTFGFFLTLPLFLLPAFFITIRFINRFRHRAGFGLVRGDQARRNTGRRRILRGIGPRPSGQGHAQDQPMQQD